MSTFIEFKNNLERGHMSNAYTYRVESGEMTKFEDFAWQFATMFTPLQNLDISNGIPDVIEPNIEFEQYQLDYYNTTLEKLLEPNSTYPKECYDEYVRDNTPPERDSQNKECAVDNYKSMIDKVESWKPDGTNPVSMKEYMLKSLVESMEFDTQEDFTSRTELKSFEEYIERMIKRFRENIVNYQEDILNEIQKAKKHTEILQKIKTNIKLHSNKVDA